MLRQLPKGVRECEKRYVKPVQIIKEKAILNKLAEFLRPIKRLYKSLLSLLKSDWSINDYPIEFRQQEVLDLNHTNLTMFPWEARIINWYWMNGDGQTKQEAYLKLKEKFELYKSEGKSLPRPGSKVSIAFASISRIGNLESEAAIFFKEIFDMDYYGMFISDESSMYDFCWSDELLDEKQKHIKERFGIEIKDLEDQKIVDILGRIKEGTGIT